MASRYKVNVTEELVERATRRDSRHCMIAEALALENPTYRNIEVDLATIRWTNLRSRRRVVCLTPDVAAEALIDFDQGNKVEPFSFSLTPIQVTPSKRTTGKTRSAKRPAKPRGPKKLRDDGVIEGGKPIVSGAPLSNVSRSNTKHRVFGKKLLRA